MLDKRKTLLCVSSFYEHNTGNGAKGTEDSYLRPYCVAAYICKLGHMSESERIALESKWNWFIQSKFNAGDKSVETMLEQGRRVVQEHNDAQSDPHFHIAFVETIKSV